MAAHSAPSSRRQLRTTALTSFATALAVVGLLFAGSALTSPSPGLAPGSPVTTTGPVALLDAPVAAVPSSTPPAVRKSGEPRTTSAKPTTSTKRTASTTTTTRTTSD